MYTILIYVMSSLPAMLVKQTLAGQSITMYIEMHVPHVV